MTLSDALMVVEVGLLVWVVVQGEKLLHNDREKLRLDREQHRMVAERYEEQKRWREQKRQQQTKKTEPETSTTEKIIESLSTPIIKSEMLKVGSAGDAEDTPTLSKSI